MERFNPVRRARSPIRPMRSSEGLHAGALIGSRRLRATCFMGLCWLAVLPATQPVQGQGQTSGGVPTATATDSDSETPSPVRSPSNEADAPAIRDADFVVIDHAHYHATFQGEELTSGEFLLEVSRHGSQPAWLDFSNVRLAIRGLQWRNQGRVISGTTADDRMLIECAADQDQLRGEWGVHGERWRSEVLFDLAFPPAMSTQVTLDVPANLELTATQGLLRSDMENGEGQSRHWTLDLGRVRAVRLTVSPRREQRERTELRASVEVDQVARRDGIVMQTDLLIDSAMEPAVPDDLLLQVPESLEIQTIGVVGTSASSGTPLNFERSSQSPEWVHVTLAGAVLEKQFMIRVRAFQPRKWGSRQDLPQIRLFQAQEVKRTLALRVEPPLLVLDVAATGFLQTGLSSDEATGEIWRFEARQSEAHVAIEIDFPKTDLISDVNCLTDLRGVHPWSAALVTLKVSSGSRFNATVRLPENWHLVSVRGSGDDSRIAAWEQQANQLQVSWQVPLTRSGSHQLLLFARRPALPRDQSTALQAPFVEAAVQQKFRHQLLLPQGPRLQLESTQDWTKPELESLPPDFLRFPEVVKEIATSMTGPVLASTSEHSNGTVTVQLRDRGLTEMATEFPLMGDVSPSADVSEETTEPGDTASPTMLRLHSVAGKSARADRIHHAYLQFEEPVQADALKVSLSPAARLSLASINRRAVTVFREGSAIRFPKQVTSISELRLTYITTGDSGWLETTTQVPVPQFSVPVSGIEWTVEVPGDQVLAAWGLPSELMFSRVPAKTVWSRLFGPLSREASQAFFNPFSIGSWSRMLTSVRSRSVGVTQHQQTVRYFSPIVAKSLRFETWDVSQARSVAWVALLACLLIGSAGRLYQIPVVSRGVFPWLVVLFAGCVLASPLWSFIFGAMFAGSLFSMLIPRRWMRRKDVLSIRTPAMFHRKAVVTSMLAISTLVLNSGQDAGRAANPSPATGSAAPMSASPAPLERNSSDPASPVSPEQGIPASLVETSPSVVTLIQSARYDLTSRFPTPVVHATFQVLARPNVADPIVKFSVQDVVFETEGQCQIDGQLQPLIPAVSGDAVLVRLPQTAAEPQLAGTWRTHTVEFDFVIRGGKSGVDPRSLSFNAGIPRVMDAEVILPESAREAAVVYRGDSIATGLGNRILYLGPIDRFQTRDFEVSGSLQADAWAVTMLRVSPLRLAGETRLMNGRAPWPERLLLQFPPGTAMGSVSGPDVLDWQQQRVEEGLELLVHLRSRVNSEPVQLQYEFRSAALVDQQLEIPAIPLVAPAAGGVRHQLALIPPPAATLSLLEDDRNLAIRPENWDAPSDSSRDRPSLYVQLEQPRPITVQWEPAESTAQIEMTETLYVKRDSLHWNALAKITVSKAPRFFHTFRLDPDLRVESVTAGEKGTETSLRFSHRGEQLTVFLPGGQLGERSFTITGQKPFSIDRWQSISSLQPEAMETTETQLVIRDESEWNLELQAADGSVVQATPQPASLSESSAERPGRLVAMSRRGATPRPARVRANLPQAAVRVEAVSWVRPPGSATESWEMDTVFHFTSQIVPITKATILIPPRVEIERGGAGELQEATVAGQSSRLTIAVPDNGRLYLRSRIRPADTPTERGAVALPILETTSGRMVAHFLLLDSNASWTFRAPASQQVSASALPQWLNADWKRQIELRQPYCFQQLRPVLDAMRKTDRALAGQAEIDLEETVIWPFPEGVQAVSRVWLRTHDAQRLIVRLPEGVILDNVFTDQGAPVVVESLGAQTQAVSLAEGAVSSLVLHWHQRGPQPTAALLDYVDAAPAQRLVATFKKGVSTAGEASAAARNSLVFWLLRWEALLKSLDELSKPVPMDGTVLSAVTMCQQQAAVLIRRPDVRSPSLRKRFENLAAESARMREKVVISGDVSTGSQAPLQNVFAEALVQNAESGSVRCQIVEGHSLLLPAAGMSWRTWLGQVLLSLAWGGALWLSWRFAKRSSSLRDVLARHPGVSVMLMGLCWWFWLAFSPMGILLVVCGAVWELRNLLRVPLFLGPSVE